MIDPNQPEITPREFDLEDVLTVPASSDQLFEIDQLRYLLGAKDADPSEYTRTHYRTFETEQHTYDISYRTGEVTDPSEHFPMADIKRWHRQTGAYDKVTIEDVYPDGQAGYTQVTWRGNQQAKAETKIMIGEDGGTISLNDIQITIDGSLKAYEQNHALMKAAAQAGTNRAAEILQSCNNALTRPMIELPNLKLRHRVATIARVALWPVRKLTD